MIYGYCRISTSKQNIDRQIRNIYNFFPSMNPNDIIVISETYTGTITEGRKEWAKLLKHVKEGDTIVFDSVSRMSRNAEEGMQTYEELFQRGVNLVFLKEHYIDTDTYRKAINGTVAMTGTTVDCILKGINEYMLNLAKEQIKIAFDQAEKEVTDLHQRTKEGILTVKKNNELISAGIIEGEIKQIGAVSGKKLNVKKAVIAKEQIKKYSKDFDGHLSDVDVMKIVGIARNTYYKYKQELKSEI